MIQLHSHYGLTHSWRYFDKIEFTNLVLSMQKQRADLAGGHFFDSVVAVVQTQRMWRRKLCGLKSNPEHRSRLGAVKSLLQISWLSPKSTRDARGTTAVGNRDDSLF